MKIIQSSIFRALCAIIIGGLLVKYPDDTLLWLTRAIGVLFLISGIIALIAYWNARKHAGEYTITDQQGRVISGGQPTFPIVGIGSVILGLVLALTPTSFVNGLMYVLGAILILGGINQLMSLVNARRFGSIPLLFWIFPSVVLLTGLVAVLRPILMAEMPLYILGWCSLLYGMTEIINALKIYSLRRKIEREQGQQPAAKEPEAEEISSEVNRSESTTKRESTTEIAVIQE